MPPTDPEQDLAELRREVERDFLRNQAVLARIARKPSREGLRIRLQSAVVEDSPYFDYLLRLYQDMVARDRRIMDGDPPILEQTVEHVELRGTSPYVEAVVTYCLVANSELIAVGSDGERTVVGRPQGLAASRATVPLRLTGDGWKEYQRIGRTDGYWQGRRACPGA